jgi:hypothetical protein
MKVNIRMINDCRRGLRINNRRRRISEKLINENADITGPYPIRAAKNPDALAGYS